jgi:hypothetical protein
MAGRIAYYGGIVTNGLVLDLDAAKKDSYPGTGTAWNDISGNRNNGTLTNGPTFSSNNGGSIVFDGVDDYTTGSFNQNPTQFTINVWVNLITNNTVGAGIVSTNGTGETGTSFIFIQMGGGVKPFQFNTVANTVAPTLNTWYMVTGVQTATQQSLYINNSLINTSTASGSLGTNYVVSRRWDGLYLNARIGSVQIYNRALSAAEITQNYNALKGRYGL